MKLKRLQIINMLFYIFNFRLPAYITIYYSYSSKRRNAFVGYESISKCKSYSYFPVRKYLIRKNFMNTVHRRNNHTKFNHIK